MKKKIVFLSLVVAFSSMFLSWEAFACTDLTQQGASRIVSHGDSIAFGIQANTGAQANNATIAKGNDYSRSGAFIGSALNTNFQRGDVVILAFGNNDQTGDDAGINGFRINLTERVNAIKNAGATPILLGTSGDGRENYSGGNFDDARLIAYDNIIQEVARSTGSVYSPIRGRAQLSGDGIHFTADGYRQLLINALSDAGVSEPCIDNNSQQANASSTTPQSSSSATPQSLSQGAANALSSTPNVGQLNAQQVAQTITQNPAIANTLNNTLQSAGIPATVEQITLLAQIAADPAQLLQNPQLFGQFIATALQQIAPQLAQQLSQFLGGNLSAGLSSAIQSQQQQSTSSAAQQQQQQGDGCSGCTSCANCPIRINQNHSIIRQHTTSEFEQHRSWFVTTWWIDLVAPALGAMTSQLTANMMGQVQAIGAFFDAKHQLETQRIFNTLTAKAHKDYHPSEELCTIGTNVRSLAASERKSNLVHGALSNYMMQRQLSAGDSKSKEGIDSDRRTRLKTVLDTYCRATDNGGDFDKLCESSDLTRINKDVDFTNTLDSKLTLDIDFSGTENQDVTHDEEDILALSANLFAHEVIDVQPAINLGRSPEEITPLAYYYLDYRAVAAKRSVAQNSFAAIVGEKAEGDEEVAPFMRAILAEAGVNAEDIEKRLGEKPSYFAQMEVMTKDIYQNPTFYSNLYDKPVNVERKSVALQAIELMQDRDIYNSLLRSEAVLATLVETMLLDEHKRVSAQIDRIGVGQ